MPPELSRLMQRYIDLARLLPSDLDLPEDLPGRAELRIVLAEMNKVKGQIDAFLAKAKVMR